MAKLRVLLGLILAMIGWVLIVAGLAVAIWFGMLVAVVLVALWIWWLRVKRDRDSDWTSVTLTVVIWACWGIAAWVGLVFAIYIGAFAGSALGLWDFYIADR